MADKEKHSPLPLVEAYKGSGVIEDADGKTVMIIPTASFSDEIYFGNIDYFLHCVNAHDKLVEAIGIVIRNINAGAVTTFWIKDYLTAALAEEKP